MQIKRGNNIIANVFVKAASYTNEEINGNHFAYIEFDVLNPIALTINDYISYLGEQYYIRYKESIDKQETSLGYSYKVTLYHDFYRMHDVAFFLYEQPDFRKNMSFYTGTAAQVVQLVVNSMNRVLGGWSVGSIAETNAMTFDFKDKSCAEVIDELVNVYELEFWVIANTVNIGKREYASNGLVLSQGAGFRSISLSAVDDTPPTTRLYAYGSDRNLTAADGDFLSLPEGAKYIEKNIDKYGVIEYVKQFEDVYPKGTFTVTQKIDNYTLRASGMDFNLTDQLIDGAEIILTFQDGGLAGYDFGIVAGSWNNDTKQLKLKTNEEENALTVPGDINFSVGNTFILTGLHMPQSYIAAAQQELEEVASKWLDEHCENRVQLQGTCDEIYFAENDISIACGQMIGILDAKLDIDREIRITALKRFIENDGETPYRYEATISDFLQGGGLGRAIKEIKDLPDVIDENYNRAIRFTKRRFQDSLETIKMLEGALLEKFTDAISPIAVQTMAMLVGDESLQFRFVNSKTNPTEIPHDVSFNPETKILTSDAGILQHLTIGVDSISSSHAASEYKFWDMAAYISAPLAEATKKYYLYAKVEKTGTEGVFILSETAIAMESVAGYYHLLTGILNSEFDGERSYVSLYGFTEILPGRITTDRIVSSDGQNFIDFLNNAARIGNSNTSLEFNTNGDGKLVLKGTLVQSQSGITQPIGVFRGAYNNTYTYYNGDLVTYNGSTYRYINNTPSSNIPTNTTYWSIEAAAGTSGSYKSFVFRQSYAKPTAPTGTNPIPAGWADSPQSTAGAINVTDGTTWTLESDGLRRSASIGNGGFTKNRISFQTALVNQNITIRLKVSSEEGYDYAMIGAPDVALTTGNFINRISGEMEQTFDIALSAAGNHFIEVGYSKDSSATAGQDCAWYEVVLAQTWWMSSSLISYNGSDWVAGAWSAPIKITGEDGEPGMDGKFWDYKYKVYPTQPDVPAGLQPSGWSDTPPAVFSGSFLWMSFCEKNADLTTILQNWSTPVRISGEKGDSGQDGEDGANGTDGAYYEYQYGINGSTTNYPTPFNPNSLSPGSAWSTTFPTSVSILQYVWMTIVKKQNPTALYPGSSWSTPVRIKPADGADGTDGTNGADGYSPAMLYRGVYNQKPDGVADVLNYFGNEKRVDCVKYNGTYYIARVDAYKNYTVNPDQPFNGILPTNSNYWNTFGAQLDSIATGLLLAELAYVENLIVGRLSTGKDDLLPRLLATGIEIGFYLNKSDEDDMSKAPIRLGVVTGQMGNGANKPGFLVKDVSGNNSATEVSSEGIFTNGSDINRYDAASAIQSCNSLVAFLEKRAPGTPADKTLNAAIVGIDNTETNYPTIPEIGLGGYFNKLMIAGLYLKCRRINETMTSQERVINEEDVFISMYNAASTSIFLSLPQTAGKILFIRINSSFGVTIDAYSNSFGKNLLLENGSVSATKTASTIGELITLVWDGNYWLYSTTAS